MPQRLIIIPAPIAFVDPETQIPVQGPQSKLDFAGFLAKLWTNPMWNESWQHGLAQRSIATAFKAASAAGEGSFLIAGEDWELLAMAAKTPRTVAAGQIVPGIGYMPAFASQVLPMQLAIINAEVV